MTPAQAQVLAPSPSMPTGLTALSPPFLMPDAGPLITLAYASRLDLLLRPSWPLQLVDMVLHELARNATPTRVAIQAFVAEHQPTLVTTATFLQFQALQRSALNAPNAPHGALPRKAGLGELALQEAINALALAQPPQPVVLLFKDHKIASTAFHLPAGRQHVSTRAFLLFLQEKGWLDSAVEVERQAVLAGRKFSQLRFP